MQRKGRTITGRCDYIIGNDRRDLLRICIRDPRVSTDYPMILEELRGCRDQRNHKYCRERSSWPIAAPKRGQMREEYATFDGIRKLSNKPTSMTWERAAWISEATWRLVDQRTALRQKHPVDQQDLWTTTRRFQALIKEESK